MFVELHLLQNFAPSNLNRDDTGAPKDCEFGGYRRARISSQCLKRAIRETFRQEQLLTESELGLRTKRLLEEITDRLVARSRPREEARAVAAAAIQGLGLAFDKNGEKTQYLLFLGDSEVEALADACDRHWEQLSAPANAKKDGKKSKEALTGEVGAELKRALDGRRAVDVALFGRMVADLPDKNVDAACQVAHALSTHRVGVEFDFYTAVDDLKPDDTQGADMMGTVEFNSACYYRYANVDLDQLLKNLGGDKELARRGLEAFLRAAVLAVPTGKQNSMAAQNPPSFVMAVVRERGLWSLANAFLKPVRSTEARDLMQESIARLDSHWAQLLAMYGKSGIRDVGVATTEPASLDSLQPHIQESLGALVEGVMQVTDGGIGAAAR